MMKLQSLARFIDIAVSDTGKVFFQTEKILKLCGEYYQPYYQLLYLLSLSIDKGTRVELGVEKGRGIGVMAMANNLRCVGLDNNLRLEASELSKEFPHLEVYLHPSLPVPDFILPETISILHIDTEHSYAMAKAEFEAYKPYLLPGAVVLFDDLHAQDNDVLRYFTELPYPKIQDDRLHPVCGYGVMIYE